MYYLLFLASAAAVIFAGKKMSVSGDIIAEKTGLGHSFIGLTLIAASTSLPEVISSVGAVTIVDNPDLAFGNVYGSNMFNMLVIFIMDAMYRKGSILAHASKSNVTTGLYVIILTMISGVGLFVPMPSFGWLNITSIAIFAVYLLSMYTAFIHKDELSADLEEENINGTSLSSAFLSFAISAAIIVAAGLALSKSADFIATDTGLGGSFVGNFMLAFVTSLPELAVCIAAVKIGSVNMAVGNLIGSNIFNITVIGICDLFYLKGDVYSSVSRINTVAVLITSIVVALVLLGIELDKTAKKHRRISVVSWCIAALYTAYMLYVYFAS